MRVLHHLLLVILLLFHLADAFFRFTEDERSPREISLLILLPLWIPLPSPPTRSCRVSKARLTGRYRVVLFSAKIAFVGDLHAAMWAWESGFLSHWVACNNFNSSTGEKFCQSDLGIVTHSKPRSLSLFLSSSISFSVSLSFSLFLSLYTYSFCPFLYIFIYFYIFIFLIIYFHFLFIFICNTIFITILVL